MTGNEQAGRDSVKRWPVWRTIAIDVLLIALSLCAFALFDHVLPRKGQQVVRDEEPQTVSTDASMADFSEKFADKFTSGEVIRTDDSYQSADLNIAVTRHDVVLEDRKVVYYVEDIYIRNMACLRTAFAEDTFGKGIRERFEEMVQRNGAIAAINGDYYAFNDTGIVIRNGVLYRDTFMEESEVLIIYRDGTMKVFKDDYELDVDREMANGAWQSFSFGPGFLDDEGNVRPEISTASIHPRTMIGMIEPGHYVFVVVDGRQEGYSEGAKKIECAQICKELGCKVAYNLDGGKTSQMMFEDRDVNQPYHDGRRTSDIIYVIDLSPD